MSDKIEAARMFCAAAHRNGMLTMAEDFDAKIVRIELEWFPIAGIGRRVEVP